MKIYLVKPKSGSSYIHRFVSRTGDSRTRRFYVPMYPVPFDNDVDAEECCELLKIEWHNWIKANSLVIEFKTKPRQSENTVHLWIGKSPYCNLEKVFGNDATFSVECTCDDDDDDDDVINLKAFDMPVKCENNTLTESGALILCEDQNAKISDEMFSLCGCLGETDDALILSVFVQFSSLNLDSDRGIPRNRFKTMLEENVLSDLEIVASNGTAIKCHKFILAAYSPVFRTMLEGPFEEGKTGIIQTDIDQESIKALLGYLYNSEVSLSTNRLKIAVDLLQVGHKYDISSVEEKMKKIILGTSCSKFQMDDAVKLFLFTRNLDQHNCLKMKAVQSMKSSLDQIHTSKEFKNLLKLEGNAGAEVIEELTFNILFHWKEETKHIPE